MDCPHIAVLSMVLFSLQSTDLDFEALPRWRIFVRPASSTRRVRRTPRKGHIYVPLRLWLVGLMLGFNMINIEEGGAAPGVQHHIKQQGSYMVRTKPTPLFPKGRHGFRGLDQ